ncbi:MAG: hypothetical protein Q4E06_00240 [Lautropia sp.]|nr:hypothetical protein [Lautropia sp.]
MVQDYNNKPRQTPEAPADGVAAPPASVSNLVEDLTVVDGEIRFITPADRGKTETIRLVIEGNTTRRPLEIALGSPRFLEIADTSEFDDDVLDRAPIPLKVHGLGAGNRIGHEGLTFEIDRDIELHHDASDVTMAASGDEPLYLQEYWQPLPSGQGFFLSAGHPAAWLHPDALPCPSGRYQGASDLALFHPGLQGVDSQEHRALNAQHAVCRLHPPVGRSAHPKTWADR